MEYDNCPQTGKRMFATLGDAKSVLNKPKAILYSHGKRVKRRMTKREEKRAYQCEFCSCWHLTSKEHYNDGKFNANKKKKF